ncbi:MAG: recombinase family protein [Burkholderiaceae bacterium]|nr:recombinase family protein [Burkholderiaceae bacterium]
MSRVFAYCRVSTTDQTPENQVQQIAAAGFNIDRRRIVTEAVSGSVAASERLGWRQLLNKLEPGDVVVVTKIDRLGRNAMDVRATVEALEAEGIKIHCLALGGMDLTSSTGKMTMAVLGAVAEFERDLLIERTHAGLQRARTEGKLLGRPQSLTDKQREKARTMLRGGYSVSAVARELLTSRATVMRIRDASKA